MIASVRFPIKAFANEYRTARRPLLAGRLAQLALMAAARREMRTALEAAVQLMGELDRAGQSERFAVVVLYVLRTQDEETLREFGAALRREVRGPGGDMNT